jgi:hypothetical protein
MQDASQIAATVIGTAAAAFVIWCLIRLVNTRRLPKVVGPALMVGACLWLPFSWLVLMGGGWDDYRLGWLKMWPFLPGFLPGALLFHPNDVLEFSTMAASTLVVMIGLTWLACRSRLMLVVAAAVALLISIPSALLAYTVYCA